VARLDVGDPIAHVPGTVGAHTAPGVRAVVDGNMDDSLFTPYFLSGLFRIVLKILISLKEISIHSVDAFINRRIITVVNDSSCHSTKNCAFVGSGANFTKDSFFSNLFLRSLISFTFVSNILEACQEAASHEK
jgi:hypothetical protein